MKCSIFTLQLGVYPYLYNFLIKNLYYFKKRAILKVEDELVIHQPKTDTCIPYPVW